MAVKFFMTPALGTDPIELFWAKLTRTICKLGRFKISNFFPAPMKRSTLSKRVSKFRPESFVRLAPASKVTKLFFRHRRCDKLGWSVCPCHVLRASLI